MPNGNIVMLEIAATVTTSVWARAVFTMAPAQEQLAAAGANLHA